MGAHHAGAGLDLTDISTVTINQKEGMPLTTRKRIDDTEGISMPRGSFRPAFQRFRYASSTRPKKTIADATPIGTHTVSKPLPNGRSKLNPSASIVPQTTPLRITGQLIGTSQLG
jgi:hypothetical protein